MKLKRKHKIEISMTLPTIADLAMLLMIFFVLTGKITSRTGVEVDPPRSVTADLITDKPPVSVTVTADGTLYLDGRRVGEDQLRDELEGVLSKRTDRPGRTVHVEVDRRTAYRDYVVAVDAVSRAKGYVELKVTR